MSKDRKEYLKAYRKAHRAENRAYQKSWRESHTAEYNAYHRNYKKDNVNSSGQSRNSIRNKSQRYLDKYGTKITGYQIHHCCTYNEPYKFIYCSKEIHLQIHAYLRQHNIPADSNHYKEIKHLLDDSVVLYGIEDVDK